MNSDQADRLLALTQSMYDASIDTAATAHNALAQTQYMATVIEVGVLVVLSGFIILLLMLRGKERLN